MQYHSNILYKLHLYVVTQLTPGAWQTRFNPIARPTIDDIITLLDSDTLFRICIRLTIPIYLDVTNAHLRRAFCLASHSDQTTYINVLLG